MADVRDEKEWRTRVDVVRKLADTMGAEFDHKRFGNGKECVSLTQYYRPIREVENVKS